MDKIKKIDEKVMKLLSATVIRRLICNTNKGPLELMTRKGEKDYFLTVDSIPLDKEVNKELMDLMFGKEVPQVEIITKEIPLKKKGRPFKAK
jgi:hypothetical protein